MDHINSGPHQLLKENPTTKIKTKTLKQLKVLKDNKFIDNKLYYYLKSIDSSAPRFYGQPKIHKGDPASSTTAEIYMQVHERTLITTALHSPKVWERFAHKVYSIYKRTYLENFFHHINNLHQNIKFTMEKESNGELAFLDTLLKRNNGEISVLVYRKPTHTDQYLHYSSHHQTSCKESVVSSLFNRAYSIIKNKDYLHKENASKC